MKRLLVAIAGLALSLASVGTVSASEAPTMPGGGEMTAMAGVHIYNANSGKCLEIQNSSHANGAPAQQWQCVAIPTMRWIRHDVPGSPGWYYFVNENSGKCLEVQNSSHANGAQVQQWQCLNIPTMQWGLARGTHAWYMVNRNSGKCLEVQNSSHANGARVQQWQCVDIPTMQWRS